MNEYKFNNCTDNYIHEIVQDYYQKKFTIHCFNSFEKAVYGYNGARNVCGWNEFVSIENSA